MRTAISVGWHKDGSAEILAVPTVPIDKQKKMLKEMVIAGHPSLVRTELWISDGIQKRYRLKSATVQPESLMHEAPPSDDNQEEDDDNEQAESTGEPTKRKPGRPRKLQ